MLFEIARNKGEAEDLARRGFGYGDIKDAERALQDPAIDEFYRNKLKIYVVRELSHAAGS